MVSSPDSTAESDDCDLKCFRLCSDVAGLTFGKTCRIDSGDEGTLLLSLPPPPALPSVAGSSGDAGFDRRNDLRFGVVIEPIESLRDLGGDVEGTWICRT
jgi:hypothetical protein